MCMYCTFCHPQPYTVRVLAVQEQASLILNEQLLLIITVRRNSLCPETDDPVLVTFGAMAVTGGDCVGQQNTTARPIPPGTSVSFFVDAATISLGPDQIYCFNVILDGVSGESTEMKTMFTQVVHPQ